MLDAVGDIESHWRKLPSLLGRRSLLRRRARKVIGAVLKTADPSGLVGSSPTVSVFFWPVKAKSNLKELLAIPYRSNLFPTVQRAALRR